MKLEIKLFMIVASHLRAFESPATYFDTRRYLMHVINPKTGRCFCGRNAFLWDQPYEGDDKLPPTALEIVDDDAFCRSCRRAMRVWLAVES